MNGLRYIRTRCNFSLTDLAQQLGVSRQMVSVWEMGKKAIPQARKEQLGDFFGLPTSLFGEIAEQEAKELLEKAMFRYVDEAGNETYRYRPRNKEEQVVYFFDTMEESLDEKMQRLQRDERALTERMQAILSGPPRTRLLDQMLYSRRGQSVYGKVTDLMETCYSADPGRKMQYYLVLLDVLEAAERAFRPEEYRSEDAKDEAWVEHLTEEIRVQLEKHLEALPPRPIRRDDPDPMPAPPMEQRIMAAEEHYRNYREDAGSSKAMVFGEKI